MAEPALNRAMAGALTDLFPSIPTVPVHPDIWKPTDDAPYNSGGLEDTVDRYIAANPMKGGANFYVPYPTGAKLFQYLGPNSGGRKDWMEAPTPKHSDLTS